MFTYFCFKWILGLFLRPTIFFIKIRIKNKWYFIQYLSVFRKHYNVFHIHICEVHICFSFQKNKGNLDNGNLRSVWTLFLLIMLIVLFHPSPFGIIKIITCFSRFELCFRTKSRQIFSLLAYKTWIVIARLFFSIFFQ